MLHILLCILKWIGIILLSILALVLLVLLAVLFVPLRYKVKGSYEEKPDAAVTISWLLHLIHVKVRYTDALFWQVRIFGIPFLDSRREKKQKAPEASEASEANEALEANEASETVPDNATEVVCAETAPSAEETAITVDEAETADETETVDEAETADEAETTDEPERKGIFSKLAEFLRALFRTIGQVFRKIRYTIHNICDKIRNVRENIGYFHSVLTSEEGHSTLALVKRELGNLFKHITPRKFKLDLHFGFDDPSTTGQVMGIAGMLYPLWNYDITLCPDFEQKVMAGKVYIRGRIRVFTLIRIAWRVYFNKNLKKVLAMLKKGGANHG